MGDSREVLPTQAILRLPFDPQQQVRTDEYASTGQVSVEKVVNGSPQLLSFSFHSVVDSRSDPHDQYDLTLKPVIAKVLAGFDAAVLLIGTSKSGKLDYLFGPGYAALGEVTAERGMLFLSVADIFRRLSLDNCAPHSSSPDGSSISEPTGSPRNAVVRETTASQVTLSAFVVIYEDIFDLLHPDFTLHDPRAQDSFWTMRQSAGSDPFVKNLTVAGISGMDDLCSLLTLARSNQQHCLACYGYEMEPERTQMVVTVSVTRRTATLRADYDDETTATTSKLHFVSHFASERNMHHFRGLTLRNATTAGWGFRALPNVVSALTDPTRRVLPPYRDSKLTRFLEKFLGKHGYLVCVGCVSQEDDVEESVSTLRLLNRFRCIVNQPAANASVRLSSFEEDSVTT